MHGTWCGRRTEPPVWGSGPRNARRFPTILDPSAGRAATGPASGCADARRGLQGPVRPSPDGRRPAARVRSPGMERRARLLDPGEAPRGVRERRFAPAPRRLGVAAAFPGRGVAVPAGDARIPVHDRPVHGSAGAGLHRAAVPGPHPPGGARRGGAAAAGAAGGAVQRVGALDRAGRGGGPHRAGGGGAGAASAVAAVLSA